MILSRMSPHGGPSSWKQGSQSNVWIAGRSSEDLSAANIYTGVAWLSIEKQRRSVAVGCCDRLPAESK